MSPLRIVIRLINLTHPLIQRPGYSITRNTKYLLYSTSTFTIFLKIFNIYLFYIYKRMYLYIYFINEYVNIIDFAL